MLARGLDAPDIGPDDVLAATESVVAALEIVDSRVAGWDISIVDTVADNASSGLFTAPRTYVRTAAYHDRISRW